MSEQHLPLTNRVAVVTGASSGIGKATALALMQQGASVVANARGAERLQELKTELVAKDHLDRLDCFAGDAGLPETIAQLLDRAAARFGEPDLVVVNAGRGLNGSVLTSDATQWEEMIRTNLTGAMHLLRAAGLRMKAARERTPRPDAPADLVVIGSVVGKHISPFSSAYGGTKFAISAVTEALRREVAPLGIRVTVVSPGFVRSGFQRVAGYAEDWFESVVAKIGPVLDPQDVARTIAFIVSQPAHVSLNDVVIRPTKQDYP